MQIIPGLPNDVALRVLVHLPARLHRRAMEVSSLWRIAIQSDHFYTARRLRFGSHLGPSLFLLRTTPHGRLECLDIELPIHYTRAVLTHHLLFSCDLASAPPFLRRRGTFCAPHTPASIIVAGGSPNPSHDSSSRIEVPSPTLSDDTYAGTQDPNLAVNEYNRTDHVDPQIGAPADVHRFDIVSRQWSRSGHMISHHHTGCQACFLDSRTFVIDRDGKAEVFDHVKNHWTCIESLPTGCHYDLCFTCQGQVFARGSSETLYSLDLVKLTWAPDVAMTRRLERLAYGSKVVARADGTLFAVAGRGDHLSVTLQRRESDWVNMLTMSLDGNWDDVFLFCDGNKVLLVLPDKNSYCSELKSERVGSLPYFEYLRVPCSELPLVTILGSSADLA